MTTDDDDDAGETGVEERRMTTDKTGAETTVRAEDGKYTIAVEGETVGLAAVADRNQQRVFYHAEVDDRFEGRGLATILVQQALEATRADGKRVVATCPMVAAFIKKHPEFADITDPVKPEILQWVETL
jgi:predicted GNAT family acetyltransferase